jgi:hypothetical protein
MQLFERKQTLSLLFMQESMIHAHFSRNQVQNLLQRSRFVLVLKTLVTLIAAILDSKSCRPSVYTAKFFNVNFTRVTVHVNFSWILFEIHVNGSREIHMNCHSQETHSRHIWLYTVAVVSPTSCSLHQKALPFVNSYLWILLIEAEDERLH